MRTIVDLELPDDGPVAGSYRISPRLSDVDFGGIVHHTVLLRYFEDARVSVLKDRGFPFERFAANKTIPVVSRLCVEYRAPVVHDSEVTLQIFLGNVRTRAVTFTCKILQNDQLCVRAAAEIMVVNDSGNGSRLPQELLDALLPAQNKPTAEPVT